MNQGAPPVIMPALISRLLPTPAHHLRFFAVLAILLVGLLHRGVGLGTIPPPHATDDEVWYAWSGLSILHGEKPTAWSMLPGYRNRTLGWAWYANEKYHFVRPALDHPPLFPLLAGAFVSLTGPARMKIDLKPAGSVNLWDINLGKARILSLIMYTLAFLLLLDLVTLSLGFWPAVVAVAAYSFGLPIVLHQRLLVADNLAALLLLGNLVVLQRFFLGRCSRRTFTIATLVLVPCATLTKIVAVTQAAVVGGLLLMRRQIRLLWIPVAGAAIGAVLLVAYAAALDWQLFRLVQGSQADRFSGFNFVERLLGSMQLVGHGQFSFFLCIGWIFALAMALDRSAPPLAVGVVCYVVAMTFFADSRRVWGWHQLSLYPFLCMGYGWVFRRLWRSTAPGLSITVLGLLLIWVFQDFHLLFPASKGITRFGYVIAVLGIFSVTQLSGGLRTRAIRSILVFLMASGLLLEVARAARMTTADFPEAKKQRPTGAALEVPAGFIR
ncbi:MAG: hypothetical protein ACR2IE_07635 [Candidatus Sumerlaeaceae bacterium]